MRTEEDYEDGIDEESSPEYNFLVMWCNEGLECVVELDMAKLSDGAEMLAVLEDSENKYSKEINRLLFMLTLRAQANGQRNYEIYKLTTTGINKAQIERMFETNPQGIVDLIREKGVNIYGSKGHKTQIII
jgi:hypothetical protein